MLDRIATLKDGVRIVVPDDLHVMTTFILEEQGDWFEDELPFVRKLVGPGDKVVDIGANFGTYTLSMAARVGETGSVVAFEPASSTAEFLRKSVALNGFSWVRVEQVALADKEGDLELSIGASPELNQLGRGSGKFEVVKVRTLANYEADLEGTSFIKLDAEGAEVAILQGSVSAAAPGSKGVLERDEPLVMFELMHGAQVNTALVEAFEARGFGIYRLVIGLGALRPFDARAAASSGILNLFAAKPSRASKLSARGLLVDQTPATVELDRRFANELWDKASHKKRVLGKELPASIAWWGMSQAHPDPAVRAFALARALETALRDVAQRPTVQRRLTLARIATESGERARMAEQLPILLRDVDPELIESEAPFLPALPRYDAIDPGERIGPYMAAQTIEAFVRALGYSSFFQGPEQIALLEAFQKYPFPEPEMKRRLVMTRNRLGSSEPLYR